MRAAPILPRIALVVLFALSLTSCAQAPAGAIDSEVSAQLSDAVVDLAVVTSEGDYAAALLLLTDLDARVEKAAADDDITAARLVTLTASLTRVRAEIDALAAATTQTPAPQETETDPESVSPTEPIAPAPPATDIVDSSDSGGSGDNGNGNSNGNGNGNGNGNAGGNGNGNGNGSD